MFALQESNKGRGVEASKRRYVELEPGELDVAKIESTYTIEIDSFVPKDEIDERKFNKPCYNAPDGKAALKPYAVLQGEEISRRTKLA